MTGVHEFQKRMEEMQKNDSVLDAFSKIVSGKIGYKSIIEKKIEIVKCKSCFKTLEGNEKFCPDCGMKVER